MRMLRCGAVDGTTGEETGVVLDDADEDNVEDGCDTNENGDVEGAEYVGEIEQSKEIDGTTGVKVFEDREELTEDEQVIQQHMGPEKKRNTEDGVVKRQRHRQENPQG